MNSTIKSHTFCFCASEAPSPLQHQLEEEASLTQEQNDKYDDHCEEDFVPDPCHSAPDTQVENTLPSATTQAKVSVISIQDAPKKQLGLSHKCTSQGLDWEASKPLLVLSVYRASLTAAGVSEWHLIIPLNHVTICPDQHWMDTAMHPNF